MTSHDADYYATGVMARDRRILAKTITVVESSLPAHQELSQKIMDLLLPLTGRAVRLGITGVPGVGKSTFIESLGMFLVREGKRLAILAVDPSSSRSGGSILADKTRMEALAREQNAYIRPSPSGGALGGVARKTRETMLVCEAAGYDVVIVETVGVGQSETLVASMVDFFLVLMLAGAGDELQGIKKGIMELADAVVINKADGDNLDKARRARKEYENALHLLRPVSNLWKPPVLACSSLDRTGIPEVWQTVCEHNRRMTAAGELTVRRRRQAVAWMWALVEEGLRERFQRHPRVRSRLSAILQAVEKGETAPTAAAGRLLFLLDNPESI
ncbi:MAG: methylmalonyl Co-A mutase-associated GTPase MeaB [Thermodesulfobacteriota bacterium]